MAHHGFTVGLHDTSPGTTFNELLQFNLIIITPGMTIHAMLAMCLSQNEPLWKRLRTRPKRSRVGIGKIGNIHKVPPHLIPIITSRSRPTAQTLGNLRYVTRTRIRKRHEPRHTGPLPIMPWRQRTPQRRKPRFVIRRRQIPLQIPPRLLRRQHLHERRHHSPLRLRKKRRIIIRLRRTRKLLRHPRQIQKLQQRTHSPLHIPHKIIVMQR
mmetsp:Transcript_61958/g.73431  ORF Transcript_61958/g.73431 Transcript_61958/m.73431 type:complete len:211 (+) Transcript_61958:563-1195(+)